MFEIMASENNKSYKRTTITSALPYANGPVHIGHLAGVYIPADIYARYLRSKGEEVLFIGGSDEHGVPITIKARKEGISPQQVVDKYHEIIKKSFEELGISFDIYSRTSLPIHHETASNFFKKLYDEGKFIEKVTEQYYDAEVGQFLADRYIIGTCPICGNQGAYGDQCEQCGSSLNATDLIQPRSALSGSIPVLKATRHWFLPLNEYEAWLKKWILEEHKDDWKINVYGQCKSWLDHGLQPRAVTRDLDWGVKVPIQGTEGKVLYVWFDAPIGYISATKHWAQLTGGDWEKWWKSPDTRLIHFIGKDNIVFHCIIFPVMLKAEGSYILPDNVPANEFLNLEGDKISTSRNWAVWLDEYLKDFPGKQDVLRYVLCANAPETKDNDFTWKDFQTRNNSELVAIFGNFVNRTAVLATKFFDGRVPELTSLLPIDEETMAEIAAIPARIASSLEHFRFREALNEMMNLARLGNKYLTENEPWKIASSNMERVKTVLNISLQICANLAILCEPFLPFTSTKLRRILNFNDGKWNDAGRCDLLPSSHILSTPELLFEKIEDEAIEKQIQKLVKIRNTASETPKLEPAKDEIDFDTFSKMDIRVATILEAEKIAKTKKLLKLKVDTGLDKRTIVSGIAEYYQPEEIIGTQVCILMNLAPRIIKGIESRGMILMAQDPQGKLYFVSPAEIIPAGSQIQ
ncbi:MAG TPA: methionine--tRNA ligase [Bacteroidales bacterium]|nr:methionine--tRNA ligase [Bacteroidales bacterium]HNV17328.1 methionine--tRNA ligase [Bacteroidales bacterium]HOX79655.1 methionine--tRNA ligase [Bacteroidales bacterium]HPN49177.1 methionine--tRNA ligase [Bacteroidales bacterium]HPV34753.1 methionine--tRNA ligase [Bacteroidales bacterium]